MKRRTPKPVDLSLKESHALSGLSLMACLTYLIGIRPYADQKGEVAFTDDDIVDRMSGLGDEAGVSLELVRRELDRLHAMGRITRQYGDRAYRVIAMKRGH